MTTRLPSLQELNEAAEHVHAVLSPTPLYCWPLLCQRSGAEVWVKHENHQPVGAFKVRGGLTYISELIRRESTVQGVISATRGNHGQSIAFAARRQGLSAVIVVPHGNSREKNAAMQALGAELIEYGDDFTESADYAVQLAEQRGLHRIPSFDLNLVSGVASYWLELFHAQPDLDTVYVPIGLGSGLCAGIAARDALGCRTDLVGVVSSQAPAYALSWDAGQVVDHVVTTQIADGMAVRRPDPVALDIIRAGTERIVQVTDDEVKAAMRIYFTDTHNVAEGAGAAPLAALLQEQQRMRGKKVAIILCGGNVDHDVFSQVLSEKT